MTRILFTGVGRRVELLQAFREAAFALGRDLKVYGADLAGTAPALAYCDFSRRVVAMSDQNYIHELMRICDKDEIDLLIPTIDTDLLVLAQNRGRFEEAGTRVLISAPDKIGICRDKRQTSQFFADCGLCTPMPVDDWRKYDAGFPAFIKPRDGSSSIDAYRVDSEGDLEVYAKQVCDYIVQPFVSGREYTIDVFCDWDGNPVSIVPRERLQVRAGEVLKTRISMDERMIEEAVTICHAFQPRGPMTIQLIRDVLGTDWFIEINPRYGGGAPLSMKAGARSAEAAIRMASAESVASLSDVADGAIFSRFDQSVNIAAGHGRVRGVIFDLDDTLYPERDYVRSGFRAVSDLLGGGLEDRLWTHFEAGRPAIDALLGELGREKEKDAALEAYRSHKPDIHLDASVANLIMGLKDEGLMVGIVTDGRPKGQRAKIEALGLDVLVGWENVVITDELGGPQFRKPCDIAFRVMQRRWRLPFCEVVYVGDNPAKDFLAPRQLGMRYILFNDGAGLYPVDLSVSQETISSYEVLKIKCLSD